MMILVEIAVEVLFAPVGSVSVLFVLAAFANWNSLVYYSTYKNYIEICLDLLTPSNKFCLAESGRKLDSAQQSLNA